jgi:hypothetical protein
MMSERHICHIHRIASVCAVIVFAFGVQRSAGAEEPSLIGSMSIEDLKGLYLSCEEAAIVSRLDSGDAMYCSVIYEELKKKAFAGDFKRMKAWRDRQELPLG